MNWADVTFATATALFARVKTDSRRVLDRRVRVLFVHGRPRLHFDSTQ